jgi:two-component system, LytTR family, sensor kinase
MKSWAYVRRFFVLLIILMIFKQGDRTFTGVFEPSIRSLVISVAFLIFWFIFWILSEWVFQSFMKTARDKRSWYRRLTAVSLILLGLLVISAVIFDWGYYLIDRYLFGLSWQSVDFINPEIFDPSSYFEPIKVNPELLFGFILLFFLVYGTHIFASSFKNVKELELLAAQQKKENITAQYTALKNQIDPHFFFNSLSVLSSLIYESTELSAAYISHLSKHYRYILEMQTDSVVPVDRELEYLESYLFLLNIRHPDSIVLSINLSPATRHDCKVLPQALQMLVENAVKHNAFRKENPLVIEILEDHDYLKVRNRINRRRLVNGSTGIGLQNISKRYAFESGKEVLYGEKEGYFEVRLPKI